MREIDADKLIMVLNDKFGWENTRYIQHTIMEQPTIKPDKKDYVVLYDGRVGVIKICKCKKCEERKEYEWYINDLNGKLLEYLNTEDISKEVLYIGTDLSKCLCELKNHYENKLLSKVKEVEFLQSIVDIYKKNLIGVVE